jgi:hypothetical protein
LQLLSECWIVNFLEQRVIDYHCLFAFLKVYVVIKVPRFGLFLELFEPALEILSLILKSFGRYFGRRASLVSAKTARVLSC